jgi:hypothetical protein
VRRQIVKCCFISYLPHILSSSFRQGAGFAGGIVSAAVDGLLVANAIMTKFVPLHSNTLFKDVGAVTFDY